MTVHLAVWRVPKGVTYSAGTTGGDFTGSSTRTRRVRDTARGSFCTALPLLAYVFMKFTALAKAFDPMR